LGSGEIAITDPDGNDLFSGPLYILEPSKNFVRFNYSASFNFEELGLQEGDSFREMIIITFLNSSKTSGFGVCSNIDADGDGSDEIYAYSEYSWDSPTSSFKIPDVGSSTYQVNVSDMISSSPDSGIVTVPDWTINGTDTLNTDGSNTWTKMFNATGNGGTTHTILLNSTATCVEDADGFTFIRNKAWIDAADMTTISGSPSYSQINFVCGDVTPPNISVGDICTFTQDSYGGLNTTGFNTMNGSFSTVYPSGLVVGSSSLNWLKLTSGNAIQTFLPQYGTPSYLTANLTDPGAPPYPQNWSTSAAQFAGEVVALQLNVDLSDAAVMPQNSSEIYGNRTVKNTGTSFDGMSVRNVLGISNCLLGSTVNCSGYNSSDIGTLNGVLEKLNLNYYNCENDFNYTGPEDEVDPIIWSVEAIPDLLYPGQLYMVRVNVTDDVGVASVNITINNSGYSLTYNGGTGFWEISGINALYSGTHTVFVNAYDGVGNSDYDDSESITVDNQGPVITLNPPPQSNDVIVNGTLINLSVTDDNQLDKVWYSTDSGTTNTTLTNTTDPLYYINTSGWTDGTYTVDVYANDSVGNESTQQYTFVLDSTDPVVALTADPTITNNETNVTFTADVNDSNLDTNNVYLYCVDGTSFNVSMICTGSAPDYTCTYEWTPTNDGEYSCNVTATDEAGNSETSSNIEVIVDSIAPVITLNSPSPSGNTTYIQPGTQINISVTNGVLDDLDDVWYSVNGGANTTLSNSTDPLYYIPTAGECVHTYDIWANDTAGNLRHVTYVFNQDGIDPSINSVTATPSTMFTGDTYHLEVNATDNKAMHNVSATINSVLYVLTFNSTSGLWEAYPSAPGTPGQYTIYVDAYDKAGNDDSKSNKKIKVNAKPGPVISLHSPTNGATIPNTVPIVVNVTSTPFALDTVWYYSSDNSTNRSFDGVSGDLYSINLSGYADGNYTFYIYANNTASITTNQTYWFTLDSTDPVVTSFTANDTIFPTNTDVNFTALVTEVNALKDDQVTVSCTNSSYTFEFNLSCSGGPSSWTCSDNIIVSEPDGVYNCTATAEDLAGNTDTSSVLGLTIDTTAPVIVLNSPAADSYVTPGTQINYSVTNGVYDSLDTVQAQVDGGSYSTLTDSTDPLYYIDTTNWTDGEHCVNITANDTAGNAKSLLNKCFKVDTIAPVIHTIDTNPDFMLGGGQFNISVNATDTPFPVLFQTNGNVTVTAGLSNYTLTYNNTSGLWEGTGLQYTPPPEACGNVSLTVTATDPAGNSASDNSTNLTIVGCKPIIILLSPTNGSTISAGTTLDFTISHPFPVNANYSVDTGGNLTFNSPYDISTTGWTPGVHNVLIVAIDQYGYSSNGTFRYVLETR
jgi:hypothetical protein